MTSRERVRRCLEFDRPDRVPRDLWALPLARLTHGQARMDGFYQRWPTDLTSAPCGPTPAGVVQGNSYDAGRYRDEWGCVFENVQAGVIGEVRQPLLDDWSKLDLLRPPTSMLDIDAAAVRAKCAGSDRFVMAGCCPRPFERLQFLRGSENLYLDIAEENPDFLEALRRVGEFYTREFEVWARTPVDGMMMMDDWGSQRALLIAPAQWRKLFKPWYARWAEMAHAAGKKVFMHSDGYIFDIYEDLIEIGIDAVNSQLFCMDIEEIGRRCAGRITFWGELDRQRELARGTPSDARQAVARVVRNLYRPEGGVIAQFELGAGPLENADAAFAAWDELTR